MSATIPMNATKQPARKGFPHAICIKCGDASAAVRVRLDNLNEFTCDGCNEEFSADDVRKHVAAWQAVLAWCDAPPVT